MDNIDGNDDAYGSNNNNDNEYDDDDETTIMKMKNTAIAAHANHCTNHNKPTLNNSVSSVMPNVAGDVIDRTHEQRSSTLATTTT